MIEIILHGIELDVDFDYEPEQKKGLYTEPADEQVIVTEVYYKDLEVSQLLESFCPGIFDDIEKQILEDREDEKWEFKIAQYEANKNDERDLEL